jgi:hypothetical protein
MITERKEEKPTGEVKAISMEAKAQEAVEIERKPKRKAPTEQHNNSKEDKVEIIKNIVDHLINVNDLKLLQLTPIPRNVIIDIVWDGIQRAVLDKERIREKIPLSKIAMELYLRAIRGSNGMLATSLYSMGEAQIQGQSDVNPMDTFNVTGE